MKALTRRVTVAAATVSLLAAGTMIAQASWTVTGTVAVRAKTADMPRGATPSAAEQAGNVLVSWSAQEIAAGVRMQKYLVTAHDADVPPRADITRTVTAGSAGTLSIVFSADDLAGGKWYWTLLPRYEGWTGAESKKSDKVTLPAAADRRSVTSLVADTGPDVTAGPAATRPTPAVDPTTPAAPTAVPPAPDETPTEPAAAPATGEPAPAESSSAPIAPEAAEAPR